jgi:hypothetical protein
MQPTGFSRRLWAALESMDGLYPQRNGESPLNQLSRQPIEPDPYDLEESDLSEYKNLAARWCDWVAVVEGKRVAGLILVRISCCPQP